MHGCAPSGTASNVMAFLAKGDVALSVTMTSLSTLLSPLLTPLGFPVALTQGPELGGIVNLPAIFIIAVVAGLLGWLVFGETLTPIQALGGALVLGAVVLAQVSARKKTGAPAEADAPVNP